MTTRAEYKIGFIYKDTKYKTLDKESKYKINRICFEIHLIEEKIREIQHKTREAKKLSGETIEKIVKVNTEHLNELEIHINELKEEIIFIISQEESFP